MKSFIALTVAFLLSLGMIVGAPSASATKKCKDISWPVQISASSYNITAMFGGKALKERKKFTQEYNKAKSKIRDSRTRALLDEAYNDSIERYTANSPAWKAFNSRIRAGLC